MNKADTFTFERVLMNAGFCCICSRQFDPALDFPPREKGSLCMDATKPSSITDDLSANRNQICR
jgi:hypothetical protein